MAWFGERRSTRAAVVAAAAGVALATTLSFVVAPVAGASTHRTAHGSSSERVRTATARPRAEIAATPGSISGTVTDSGSTGLSGICVDVLAVAPTVGGSFAFTGTGGTYTATGLNPGNYDVEFMTGCGNSGNFLSQWYDDEPTQGTANPVKVSSGATTTGINAKLAAGATITGTVTTPAGKPFAGVFVSATGLQGTDFGSAITAANGTYSMTGLAADTYTVSFSAESGNYLTEWYNGKLSSTAATPVPVTAGATVSGINAKMILGGTIKGRVTSSSGAGLSGMCVVVSAVGAGNPFFSSTALTTAGGTYSVTQLPPATYAVGFSTCFGAKTNYAPQWSGGSSTYTGAKGISVGEGKTVSGVNAKMPAGGVIAGVVTTSKHKPLAGVCVEASSSDGASGFATTSSKGAYSILDLSTGAYTVSFCGTLSGYMGESYKDESNSAFANPVSVVVGETTMPVDAVLTLGGTITGHVTNAGGKNLAGICVEALGVTIGSTGGSAETASNGNYRMTGLATGKYEVAFYSGCGNTGSYVTQWYSNKPFSSGSAKVSVTDGHTKSGINAKMQVAGTLTGLVTNSGTTPLEGVCVSVTNKNPSGSGGSADTAANGSYSVTGLATGSYTVEFSPECGVTGNYANQWYKQKPSSGTATAVKVTAGKTTSGVDAKMGPGGTITGKVTNSKGKALLGICVEVSGNNGFGSATSDAAGDYSISDLGTGKYLVSFSPGCGTSGNILTQYYKAKTSFATATPVNVTAGKTTSGIDAKMGPGGTIAGTVRGPSGPMLGVCVTVISAAGSGFSTTAINGSFSITGLPSGKYTVSASTTDCSSVYLGNYVTEWYKSASTAAKATVVKVTVGKTTGGIALKLPADGAIAGVVSSSGGAKLAGICVEGYSVANPEPFEIAITAKGSYEMVQLIPGAYKVEFVAGCGSTGAHASQWWKQKSSKSSATAVSVSAGKTTGGVSAKLSP